MKIKTSPLRDAVCLALALGTLGGTSVAMAQDTREGQKDEPSTLDRIEITGSRIRQVDVETSQPILTISRQDIEKQGFSTVSDILQNISATGSPPISRAQPLSSGEAAGGSYISLRNLGAARTLVLLNGRRLGITTSGLSDVSTIPASAVERVEVLKDGASSIYGSDAIAGVINIITRTNYEGARASVYHGMYDEGDGAVTTAEFVMGVAGERGSLTAAAEWGTEERVAATDRPFSAFPRSTYHPTDAFTTVHADGGFTLNRTQAGTRFPNVTFPTSATAQVRVVLRPGGNPRNPADYINQNTNTGSCATATPETGCTPGSTLHKTNTLEQTDLRTPLERRALYVDGVYELTDDIRFRTNLLYSQRETERMVAGYPMQAASFNTPLSADSYFNPLGAPITTWWRRTWEVPRTTSSTLTTYRFSGVFEGSFEIGERFFDWDVSYLHNSNELLQSAYGNLNLTRTRAAVGPSFLNAQGRVQCGTAAAPIAFSECVPFNPLLGFGMEGQGGLTNNQQLIDFLFQEEHARGETETTVMAANLAGSLYTLPAGDLAFAVGVETRKESGEFVPDALAVTGNSTNLSSGPTRGGYSVDEVYAELQVPLLADMPFAEELTLSLARRYSDYDTFGSTTNDKVGLKWKPVDSVLVRGTYAEGFRAPTIADLYGGGSQTFSFFTDPCDTLFGASANNPTARANCVAQMGTLANTYRQLGQGFVPVGAPNAQTPVAFISGSNPTLEPETSLTKSLGVVWSPGFLDGFSAALDWWNIRIDNTIVADSPNQILSDCFVQSITSRCSPLLFTRDPAQGYINFLSFGGRNAGFREVEGFDFDVWYRTDTDYGRFTLAVNSSYTSKDVSVSTNDPRVPLSSVGIAGSGSTTFRLRSNANLGWQFGDFGINWIARYYSSIAEGCTYFVPGTTGAALEPNLECNDIRFRPTGLVTGTTSALSRRVEHGSNTFHDVQFRWEAPWDAVIAVGANNVFNHYGPVLYSQPNANVSYYGGFDIGRFVYARYTQKF